MKNYLSSIIKIIFLLLIFISCSRKPESISSATYETPEDISAKAVEAVTVSKSSLIQEVRASGIIKGKNEVWLTAETSGKVDKVDLKPGDEVKKGEKLLHFEDDIPKIQMELARELYDSAKTDFRGFEVSYKQGGLSRSDYNKEYTNLLKLETEYKTGNRI